MRAALMALVLSLSACGSTDCSETGCPEGQVCVQSPAGGVTTQFVCVRQ